MQPRVCWFLTFAAANICGASLAAAQGMPKDPIPYFRMVPLFKEACPAEYTALIAADDEQRIAAAFADVMAFEIGRTRSLRPETSEAEARKLMDTYIESATAGAKPAYVTAGCPGERNTKLITWIKTTIADPASVDEFKKTSGNGVPYDSPRPLTAAANGPMTFAIDHFAEFIMAGPLKSGKTCKDFSVAAIKLVSRTPMPLPAGHQPPHIRVQQRITENWTWLCDGTTRQSQLEFIQDDRNGRGSYSVVELTPAPTTPVPNK